ncbi:MAG: M3 family oligoendopeptidase [Candidatus Sericytochromatia bacterium]
MSTSTDTSQRWDLSKLYTGVDDPAIEAHLKAAHTEAKAIRDRYHGRVASLSAEQLAEALVEQERYSNMLGKLGAFASLAFSADTNDERIKALYARIKTELTEVHNELQFFDLELQQVPEADFNRLLDAEVLAPYRYHLERVRKYTPHTLTEPEEVILALKDVTGVSAWSQLYTEITSALKVTLDLPDGPKVVTVSEARAMRSDGDRRVREAATKGVLKTHADESHVLTYIFNTVYEDHRQTIQLRQYENPMAPTLLDEDLAPEVIEALMSAVEGHYHLAHRYYRTKARVLGIQDFASYDLLAPYAEKEKEVAYDEGKQIVLDSFRSFSPRFESLAQGFFDGRYIDVPPAPGKQGGAFCSGMRPGLHPYVLLNYSQKLDDVMTLAHELGHGIHFLLAGERQNLYNYYPITPLAETASTFAEMITVNRLLALETDPMIRRQLLASRIEDAVSTIMRQVMYTRWEQQAHAARAHGIVPAEEYCRLWSEGNQAVYGDGVKMTEWDQWGWITIPHVVKYRFYCYSYAFGQLLVYALYQQYQEEGESFVPKFLDVLAAGGNAPAGAILARVGMDIKDPAFWQKGLTLLEGMLKEFEAAV